MSIHPTYRTFFTLIDPLIATWGASLFFLAPNAVLDSFIPNSPRNPDHDFLLWQVGAHLLSCAVISRFALRLRPDDVPLWSICQAGLAAVDVIYIAGSVASFANQGRLSPALWRAVDWTCLAITGTALSARVLFLLGIGMGPAIKND